MISPVPIMASASSSVGSRISISSPSPRARRPCRSVPGCILRDEESQLLAKHPGSCRPRRHGADFAPKSGFFLGFLDDPGFGVLAFESAGTNFDQAFMAVLQKSGQAKLPHKNETRAARIVEQNRGAIAWVADLAGKALHAPIETLSFDGESFQQSDSRVKRYAAQECECCRSSLQYPNCSRRIRSPSE